ncbi:DnaJ domain-containing protein [Pseudovibrio sp. Tun.PSC04-5.I4]|uniref:J domain-containing protein n=1 Tax=Pseudovibrio sp. Tun.PSC04-5.I4 TaxID=1798213 RepID=UPI00088CF374|nr:DnaJ domain-containing protein [Pseudovibrio sp. Tun.PSC04-5.I4]SDR39243.1 DnaJ domain-containing protein [Pseudovibrio sp. Tun.PSC04-5.I4]
MGYLVMGGLLLAILYFIAKALSRSNPAKLVEQLKMLIGLVLIPVCIFLAVTGKWIAAIPLGVFALSLLGVKSAQNYKFPGGFSLGGLGDVFNRTGKSAGQTSSVSSTYLKMELDHDSRKLEGDVLAGSYSGRALSSLQTGDLKGLWHEVQSDGDSVSLLEAYLDSRLPNWRVDFQADSTTRERNASGSSTLTEKEAYEVLGLAPGASLDDVRAAHRRLIKRLHPDSGGSAFLASKLNEAKDRLLNRH